ncbi:serine hydrolase [Mycobacterium sp.]|uniref:serine hydrolase n=1 Tax=Mycobacterium sp. TaxID=1785 RepID=UPI002C36BCE4|nr:serine hydrolase [Mycobacterium sp.]HTY33863.1 serine hydrolase [Mycobacterium sp.]
MPHRVLEESIRKTISATPEIDWSICIRNHAGQKLASYNPNASMKTASLGKLLLLAEVARQCDAGNLDGTQLLGRDPNLLVADSGIWQYLKVEKLSIHDLCVLVAGVSDNLATNVLLKHVGFQRLRELSKALGLTRTALLDYVRDYRGPDDLWTLSVGSAAELSSFMSRVARKELISQTVSEQLDAWLATGMDLSMVASAFGFDPLAHAESDRGFSIRNKTGADTGIRADVGTIGRKSSWFSYAVIANWEAANPSLRDAVLSRMNSIGRVLREFLQQDLR